MVFTFWWGRQTLNNSTINCLIITVAHLTYYGKVLCERRTNFPKSGELGKGSLKTPYLNWGLKAFPVLFSEQWMLFSVPSLWSLSLLSYVLSQIFCLRGLFHCWPSPYLLNNCIASSFKSFFFWCFCALQKYNLLNSEVDAVGTFISQVKEV